MDSLQIHNLFNNPKAFNNYIKRDIVRVYDQNNVAGATRVRFSCSTLTNKLIDYSNAFLIFQGHIDSVNNLVPGDHGEDHQVGLNNNAIFKNCKCSFNTNEVEHNRSPDLSTVWLNLLEYSPDFARSIAIKWGFAKDQALVVATDNDHNLVNAAGYELRNKVTHGALANGDYPVTVMIPLKHLFQFFRRLNFPIINQLVEFELELNDHGRSLIRHTNTPACTLVMDTITLFAPEVRLPTAENGKLYNLIASGKLMKTINWDIADFTLQNHQILANQLNFDILIGTNLVGVKKILCMIRADPDNQDQIQTTSDIRITNFNFEIDSKDLYHMNVQTDIEAYRLLEENFNSQGKDVNTGSLIPYTDWLTHYRLYAFDVSRQEVFESDPYKSQQIRFRGTASAAGQFMVILIQNKTTDIDFANPQNTRTI